MNGVRHAYLRLGAPMSRRRGFTLLELLVALAIVGALLTLALGSLRVGLAAWRQGDDRAEAHAHLRSLSELLARSVAAAFPYRQSGAEGGEPQIQFKGEAGRVSFVTLAPPFPLAAPVTFTAVTFARLEGDRPGLAVREKALPNLDPFEEAEPLFLDPAVTEVEFRYLPPDGDWTDTWDGAEKKELPRAVQIRLTATLGGGTETRPPLTSSIPSM